MKSTVIMNHPPWSCYRVFVTVTRSWVQSRGQNIMGLTNGSCHCCDRRSWAQSMLLFIVSEDLGFNPCFLSLCQKNMGSIQGWVIPKTRNSMLLCISLSNLNFPYFLINRSPFNLQITFNLLCVSLNNRTFQCESHSDDGIS